MNALAILYVNAHLQDLLDEASEARRHRTHVESHRHAGGGYR